MYTGERRLASYGGIAGAALLTLGLWGSAAEAGLSGSIHAGRQQSSILSNAQRIETRTTEGSLSASFSQRAVGHRAAPGRHDVQLAAGAAGRGRYGRLNTGRGYGVQQNGVVGPYAGSIDPQWSGLIDANIAQMRRTSPYPNRYGTFGFIRPPVFSRPGHVGAGGFAYPWYGDSLSYGFGTSPFYYSGFVPSIYSEYGNWYPQVVPLERVYIIEREVVKDQDDRVEPRLDERTEPSRASDGEYYLAPRSGETLDDAVSDIKRAWMNGDYDRFKSRIRQEGKVRVYLKGKYKYSVDAADFGQMTRDAMGRVDTISFTLDPAKRRDDTHAFVSGKHVYYDPDHQKREVYVSYGLVRENGHWRIAEAGSSSEPISDHSD